MNSIRMVALLAATLSLPRPAAQEASPRPEFPQPQFQRADWLNLNGRWQFEFDDGNVGLAEQWAGTQRRFSREITVPYCFESRLSGIGDTSFHAWVWYRRSFAVPEAWKGRRVLLKFGAVDYRATVWMNGRMAGSHEGGHTPFVFDVTDLLQPGQNTVTVRAEDPPADRSIPRGKQFWEPKSRGIFYTRSSGIWQTVWLEAVGQSYLERVSITPAPDGTVRFEARVALPQGDLAFRVTIKSGGQEVASGSGRIAGNTAVAAAAVAGPRFWSPGAPNLYDVALELHRGTTVVDRVASYFGFRTVGVERGRVTLNGSPIYLRMVLDQGFWPESVLTPPTDEAIQYDIRLTKEMGFNGVRKHQKLEDPRYLYWADRIGLLISSEMANAYAFDDEYVSRFTREWMETIVRDRNHPSIVIWAPINESWGVPNLREPRQQAHLKALYQLTRSLDSSRIVIDNEGWEHTDMTDLMALHNYARTGELLAEAYKDLGKPGTVIPAPDEAAMIPGYAYNGSPFYLSEFGGIAFIPPSHAVPKESWGYSGVEKTAEAALERMRGLYAAVARMPAFAGLCYTQLTDVEQEVNGLLTFDRKPKFDTKTVREIVQLAR